jgi:GTP pyrophosphokinase
MESKDQKGRWVHASWSNDVKETYQSDIVMVCQNRLGLVADVSIALTNLHVPVHALSAKETSGGMAEVRMTTETGGVDQLKVILDTLRRIRGVETVQRV